jgi:NodT family efflux transporter outer membrane factor (OMF) lipoprotein
VHLPFDTSRLRETTAAVLTLHGRMVLLIPLLSGLAERMGALADVKDADARAVVDAVAHWIEAGANASDGAQLIRRIEYLAAECRRDDWPSLLVESLLVRLADLVAALGDSHALRNHLNDPAAPLDPELRSMVAQTERRPMHSDLPLALLSGAAATLAILVSCAIWIGTGWSDGASAAALCAVFCCFFATLDDPVPAIANFGVFTLAAIPLGALYVFAILPAIDGFPMLVAVLLPPLILLGTLLVEPKRAGAAIAAILGFSNAVALQATYSADFASFVNVNLGQYIGLFSAIFVTASMRSIGVEASVRRLQGHSRKQLAQLARARSAPAPAAFATAVVDRLGILTPKLATTEAGRGDATAVAALRDLRVGMNLVALQELRATLSGAARLNIDTVLAKVGDHFASRTAGAAPSAAAILEPIDRALGGLSGEQSRGVVRGITALVGLLTERLPVWNLADARAGVSYQVDLFGKIRRATEAARADAEATEAALDVARVSVVGDVTRAYVSACAAGYELAQAQETVDLQQRSVVVTTRLAAAGRGTAIDVTRGRALVDQSRAAIPVFEARRRAALYKLAVLTGRPPTQFPKALESCADLPHLSQPIPVGDGAALLKRRPDVRQAERSLAAATARIGVATAALYPSISIGLSGGSTGLLSDIGESVANFWHLGSLISWTFPSGRERARLKQSDDAADAALARFDGVVLNALRETETSLVVYARDLDRNAALRAARDEATEAERQVQRLYRAGRSPYLSTLDARRTRDASDAALAASDSQIADDQVSLFLVLGGGWSPRAPITPVQPPTRGAGL